MAQHVSTFLADMTGIAFFPLLVQRWRQQLSHLDVDLYVGMHVPGIGHVASHASDLVYRSACLAQLLHPIAGDVLA